MDLLDLAGGLGEVIASWRFFVSVLATLAAIAIVLYFAPASGVATLVSIVLGIIGFGGGFYWQWRADRP